VNYVVRLSCRRSAGRRSSHFSILCSPLLDLLFPFPLVPFVTLSDDAPPPLLPDFVVLVRLRVLSFQFFSSSPGLINYEASPLPTSICYGTDYPPPAGTASLTCPPCSRFSRGFSHRPVFCSDFSFYGFFGVLAFLHSLAPS